MKKQGGSCFKYRTALGCWVNDVASVPRIEPWPSSTIDAVLERDLAGFFDLLKEAKLDSVILFGLLATRRWAPDFPKTFSSQRAAAVRRILASARDRGLKVLYGLGLYSWGFDKIIEADPNVQGTNHWVMCPSKEASHEVMESLVDYLLSTFAFDGFHFESADLGRCECPPCKQKSDLVYHVELNERMARYVNSRWAGKIIEMYDPSGLKSRRDWLAWSEASKQFSFLIDPNNRADAFGCRARKEIISGLHCPYGTRGGTWTYPPQRWGKLRWFVPIIQRRADHYRRLAADGGQAAMVQAGPPINPAEEATMRCTGKFLDDPYRDVQGVLHETMAEMFDPKTTGAADEAADIFWSAENAYFSAANFPQEGELWLEPLLGRMAGPPIYLQTRMYRHQLLPYEKAILDIQGRFLKIESDLRDKQRVDRVKTCLAAVLQDIGTIKSDESYPKYPGHTVDGKTWGHDGWPFDNQ